MSYLPYALSGWLFLVGLAGIVISRNFVHMVLCAAVAQSSTYVLLLAVGYKSHGTAPIYADIPHSRRAVDPVVQALTLTDIVVSVTLAAVLLSLALKAHERTGSLDPEAAEALKG